MSISLHEKSHKERAPHQWQSVSDIMAGTCQGQEGGADKRTVLTAMGLPKLGGSEVKGIDVVEYGERGTTY